MRTTLFSILSLTTIVITSTMAEKQVEVMAAENASTKISVADDLDALNIFRLLKTQVPINPPLFDPKNHKHSPFIFLSIDNYEKMKAFTRWFLEQKSGYAYGVVSRFTGDVANRVKAINAQDVAMCQSQYCCKFQSMIIKGINSNALKSITQTCAKQIASKVGTNGLDPLGFEILGLLPDNVIESYGQQIVAQLGTRFVQIPLNIFQNLIKAPGVCISITTPVWQAILTKPNLAKLISAQCLKEGEDAFKRINASKIEPINLGPDAFSNYNTALPPAITAQMSGEQMKSYAKNVEDGEFPAGYLKFKHLSQKSARGLTLRHILGNLYSPASKGRLSFTSSWSSVPEDIFSQLKADDVPVIIKGISHSKEMQKNLRLRQLNDLLKYSEICAVIKENVIRRELVISVACFRSMNAVTQSHVLALGISLPDNALAQIPADKVNSWKYKDFEGLAVLNNTKHRAAMIAKLGADLHFNHPCGLIKDVDELIALPTLQTHMSAQCFQHISVKLEKEDFEKLQPRIAFLVTFKQMLKDRSSSFWTSMSPTTFALVISGGQFCSSVDLDTFVLINKKAYSSITKECFNQLRFVNQLDKESLQAISPNALVLVTKSAITADTISKLTAEQLTKLGAEVTDESANPASLFTLETFNSLDVTQLAHITLTQWKLADAKIFATLNNRERLRAIPSSAMVFWSNEKVLNIPQNVLSTLTPAQAQEIGKSCSVVETPLRHLARLRFSEDTQKVIKERLAETNVSDDGPNITTIASIVIGAVIVVIGIGAGIFFFMRSRQS